MSDRGVDRWVPLSLRETSAGAEHLVLQEGVPPWLAASLQRWVLDEQAAGGQALVFRVEQSLHRSLHPSGSLTTNVGNNLIGEYWAESDDNARLDLIDYLIRDVRENIIENTADPISQNTKSAALRRLLALKQALDAESAWEIRLAEQWGLVRRVAQASQEQFRAATTPETEAARLLSRAWTACYRRGPDYDSAYRDAVAAVEAATRPYLMPNDSKPSLGKGIAHLRDTAPRWTVGDLDEQGSPVQALIAMLGLLWNNHNRHIQDDGKLHDVTRPEAETAINLAVTLVQWFSAGLVRRIQHP